MAVKSKASRANTYRYFAKYRFTSGYDNDSPFHIVKEAFLNKRDSSNLSKQHPQLETAGFSYATLSHFVKGNEITGDTLIELMNWLKLTLFLDGKPIISAHELSDFLLQKRMATKKSRLIVSQLADCSISSLRSLELKKSTSNSKIIFNLLEVLDVNVRVKDSKTPRIHAVKELQSVRNPF